jgi:hypothetical protein
MAAPIRVSGAKFVRKNLFSGYLAHPTNYVIAEV